MAKKKDITFDVVRELRAKPDMALCYHSWASLDKKFFYIGVPKVGCTKIKKLLQAYSKLPVPDGVSPIHERSNGTFVNSLCHFSRAEQLHLLTAPDIYRFCFVRNPYTRLLSAYWNKVVPQQYRNLRRRIFIRLRKWRFFKCPSFMDLVRYILLKPKDSLNHHYGSQTLITHYNLISYHRIGRFETFNTDLKSIFGTMGADDEVFSLIQSVENKSQQDTTLSSPLLSILRDTALGDQFYDYFKDDFINFNYEKLA